MFPDKAGSILYRKMVLGTRIRTCFRGMVSKKTYREKTKLNATSNAKAHTLLRNLFLWKELDGGVSIMKKDYKIAVAGTGARDIIRGCHNRDKGTAENERLRNPKFIFSYPKNERLIFLGGRNAAQEEISTMRVG